MTRCSAALWLAPHDVIRRWRRDAGGHVVVPHVLEWECLRCGQIVGVTTVVPLASPAPRRRLHAIVEPARQQDGSSTAVPEDRS